MVVDDWGHFRDVTTTFCAHHLSHGISTFDNGRGAVDDALSRTFVTEDYAVSPPQSDRSHCGGNYLSECFNGTLRSLITTSLGGLCSWQ